MRSRSSYPWRAAAVGVALAVSTAACGSGGGASTNASGLTGKDLVSQATKEGKVTWYTSYTDTETGDLVKDFNKVYPGIKVTTLQGTADDLATRIVTEQKGGSFKADLWQGDASYAQLLLKSKALQPYSPSDRPPAPKALGFPHGYDNVDAVLTTVIAYNPQAVKKAGLKPPTSVEDLTNPQWRGRFSVDETAVNWYESLIATMGHDKAKALVDSLGNNGPRLVSSHTLALTQVQEGEPAVTLAAYGYRAATMAKDTPTQMAFVNPNPLPSSPDVIEMARNAPHPAAAEVFMNWLLSKQGQSAIINISGRVSLRPDVTPDPAAWNPAKWRPAWSQPSLDAATINSYNDELATAFHAH